MAASRLRAHRPCTTAGDLTQAQRRTLREHAYSLLRCVGIDPPTLVSGDRTYELLKDCSDDETAELHNEVKSVRPFRLKVTDPPDATTDPRMSLLTQNISRQLVLPATEAPHEPKRDQSAK
jgi:hypothetical protein